MFTKLILFILFHSSTAFIHHLNDSDYALMPPLFHLDNYEECFDEPEAIYCLAEFNLVSDEPSQLLTMMQEYAAFPTHYNRTVLRYGFCMNKRCKKFYNVSGLYLDPNDQRLALEACTNETIYRKYKLKTVVRNEFDCAKRDREQPIDDLDIAVAAICVLIILANLVGSLCDRYLEKEKYRKDYICLRFLYCFSIFRNWKKFVAPLGDGRDSRLRTLKGIHGIRAITTFLVIASHSFITSLIFVINPNDVEDLYENKFYNIFMNGTLIMQTFLVISAFLLVYNWLIRSEKRALSWNMLPQQIILRWLRLTPSLALVLGLTVTWFGRLASGPYWKRIIYEEISDCRQNWWRHLLYINNYIDSSTCMAQTWYLAADTQLYYMGVVVFLLCRTGLTRKVMLSLLFVAGLIIPTLHIYYQKLNGAQLVYPEIALALFTEDPTFNHVYKRGHTNLTGYVIGMALGYIVYNWQQAGGNPNQFRKYRYFYWTLFVWGILCCFSGSIYYQGVQPLPVYVHLLLGALLKPIFGIIIAIVLAGLIIQFEGVYRPVLEWPPFQYLGRLSYSAYLLHIAIIRTTVVSITAIQRVTLISALLKGTAVAISSFLVAFLFLLLVESPSGNLILEFFGKPNTQTEEENKDAVEESKKAEDGNATDLTQTRIEDGTIVIKMGTRI